MSQYLQQADQEAGKVWTQHRASQFFACVTADKENIAKEEEFWTSLNVLSDS